MQHSDSPDDEPNSETPPRPGDSIASAASRALRARRAPSNPEAEPAEVAPVEAVAVPPAKKAAKKAPAKKAPARKAAATAAPAKKSVAATESVETDSVKKQPAKKQAAKKAAKEPAAKAAPTKTAPKKAEPTEAAPTAEPESTRPSVLDRLLGRTAVIAYVAVAAVLAAAVVVLSIVLINTSENSDLSFANTRDAVIVDATKDIVTINSLDYRTAANGINTWLDVSTGTLRDQVVSQKAAIVTQVQQAKVITTATVLTIAVSQLDDRAGAATVLASVEQTVTPAGKSATKKYDRYSANLTRLDGVWKLNQFTLVPV